MSLNWAKRLNFYLDPKLKTFDKAFHRQITQDLESLGINWDEQFNELSDDSFLPNIFLMLADTSSEPSIRSMDHTLIFGASNMSLFGRKELQGHNHTINELDHWESFLSNIGDLLEINFKNAFKQLFENSLKDFKELSKKVKSKDLDKFQEEILKLEAQILSFPSFEQAIENATKIANEYLDSNFELHNPEEAYGRFNYCLPLEAPHGKMIFLCWNSSGKEAETLCFYSLLEDILRVQNEAEAGVHGLEDMQFILSELPVPLALFNHKDELVLHNPLFFQLNLGSKQCLSLENDEQFNLNDELYRTQKIDLSKHEYKLFYFIPVKEFLGKSSSPSSEELGIISSSIAHELNNPLGGVSAALDVILLDDQPEDIEQRLREMKAGVGRCKKLVETFLGFSKLNAQNDSKDCELYHVESCLSSALELIRFRLIENNINLEANFKSDRKYRCDYNPHVMSMTLYLMLGDLLTNFGHQKLIADERSATFDIDVVERERSIEIKTGKSLSLGEDFLKSKLLNHLLDIQNLAIETRSNSVNLVQL